MKPRTKMILMLTGTTLIIGGTLGFVAFRSHMIKQFFANAPKPIITVTQGEIKEEKLSQRITVMGTLKALNGVDISAQAAGLVTEIRFQSGQKVKKGDVLLKLDSDIEAGELRSALAERELAASQDKRSRALAGSDFVSRQSQEKSEAEYKVKEALVAQLGAKIAKKTVLAPFDGVLGLRKVDLGQYLQPGQSIVNLQDLSTLLVKAAVPQKDLPRLQVGQAVSLSTDAWPGRQFQGELAAIEPEIDSKSGMAQIEAKIPNLDAALNPGMFVKAEIILPSEITALTVPNSAISYSLSGNSLFVIRNDEVERVNIELGPRNNGRTSVKGELKPGDKVVTAGQIKLENGSKVKVAEANPLEQKP